MNTARYIVFPLLISHYCRLWCFGLWNRAVCVVKDFL